MYLYDAVMILGRSLNEIDQYGWACGAIGHSKGPKCANGILSVAGGSPTPAYINEVFDWVRSTNPNVSAEEIEEPLRLAAAALIAAVPDYAMNHLIQVLNRHRDNKLRQKWLSDVKEPFGASLGWLSGAITTINDGEDGRGGYLNETTARAWFSRAFDLLAERLPDPVPAQENVSVPAPDLVLI